jgi:PAS domain-containing protein
LDEWAVALARGKLETTLPRRWSHVAGVIELATEIRDVAGESGALLIAAAATHDIGHAPDVVQTGFPALDGLEYLRTVNAPQELLILVANYFASGIEAELRGYHQEYRDVTDQPTAVRDALWYCDIRVGPDGHRVEVDERFAELLRRYQHDEITLPWWKLAEVPLRQAAARTQVRLSTLKLTVA